MATPSEALDELARALGETPNAIIRHVRDLRVAGALYWPKSGQGGGKAAAHVEARHMAAVILGLSASTAPAARRTVDILWPLRAGPSRQITPPLEALPEGAGLVRAPRTVPTPPHIAAQTLGERLEGMIAATAAAMVQGDAAALDALRAEGWGFSLAPDLPAAWFFGQTPEGAALSDQYQPAQRSMLLGYALPAPEAPMRRSVGFDFKLIEIAAELVADTLQRQPTRRADPALPSGGPENKEPDPAEDRALVTDRSFQTGPDRDTTSTPEPTREREDAQLLRAFRLFGTAGQPSTRTRKGTSPDGKSYSPKPAAA